MHQLFRRHSEVLQLDCSTVKPTEVAEFIVRHLISCDGRHNKNASNQSLQRRTHPVVRRKTRDETVNKFSGHRIRLSTARNNGRMLRNIESADYLKGVQQKIQASGYKTSGGEWGYDASGDA